jgi:hypothetical protein
MFHDKLKIQQYKNKSYNFNIKLNYDFKTWKNQASITFVFGWYVLLWLHPTSIKLNESMSHVVLIFSIKFIKI